MGFEKVYITSAGLELEAKSRTGKTINILRVEVGDGELTDNNIIEKTSLIHKILECELNSLKEVDSQTIINFILQQSKVDEGFYFREFGVIAKDPDTQEEVLYLYANAGNKAEFIDDKTATAINDRKIDIVVKSNNTDNVTISIDNTGVYVEREEYQTKIGEIESLINTKANKKKVYNIVIGTTGWSDTVPYTKTIDVEGILATDEPTVDLLQSDDIETAKKEIEEFAKIDRVDSLENNIILKCYDEKPTVSLNTRIEVIY